ncbi:S8 family serine peptidase [Cellulomonas sp. NPDC057328]|uniref:S8 family serine peptidase n=1 Tax=Cellulomonas sp. NPDC057328 TaxID=3346101 RepID=UPI00362C2E7C
MRPAAVRPAAARPVVALVAVVLGGLCAAPAASGAPAGSAFARTAPVSTAPAAAVAGDRGDLVAYVPPADETAPADAGQASPDHDPDHVLVRFAPGTSGDAQRSALAGVDGTPGDAVAGTAFRRVAVAPGTAAAAVAELAADPRVAAVELDPVRRAAAWPTDPYAEDAAAAYLDLVRLPRAWDVTTGAGARVAVLDTGVTSAGVTDLASAVLPGVDLVDGDADASDPDGHGTLVAGVVAARTGDGHGTVGAAPAAQVLPVRVLGPDGTAPDSRVAEGVRWAVANGADVVNLSLSGPLPGTVLREAVRAAVEAGVVVVVAAGDDPHAGVGYPAAYAPGLPGVLAVSAVDDDGTLTTFSSWGDEVTLAAPGDAIVSTAPQGGHLLVSGTSFSAPFVSGVAALLAAAEPTLTPAEVEERLVATARDAGPRGRDPYVGAGVLDAASALTAGRADRVAPAMPVDRGTGDGRADDTPARATAMPHAVGGGTLAPEGDVDWYRADVAPGWYPVATSTHAYRTEGIDDLEPRIEVRDGTGTVLARADGLGRVWAHVATAGPVLVGVAATGGPSDEPYEVSVGPAGTPPPYEQVQVAPVGGRLAVGDVTGDGRLDVVVRGRATTVLPGDGDGTLGAPVPVPGSAEAGGGVALADVDGDGRTDVLETTAARGVRATVQRDGGLVPLAAVTFPDQPWHLATADLDGDGDADLVAVTGFSGTYAAHVALNDGRGAFTVLPGSQPTAGAAVALGDVTGDGHVDLVDDRHLFAGRGDGTFADAVTVSDVTGTPSHDVVLGDVTGDGRPDVVTHVPGGDLAVTTVGPGGVTSRRYPGRGGDGVVLADHDGDGRTDVIGAVTGWPLLTVHHQRADGTLGPAETVDGYAPYRGEAGTQTVAGGDLDGDGGVDLVVGTSGGTTVLRRSHPAPPDVAAWVRDVDPAPYAAGVGVRPSVRVALDTVPDPASVDATTVRLLDGRTGARVAATRRLDAAARTLTVVPAADLVPGRTYQLVVDGLRDARGRPQDVPWRSWFTVAAGGQRFTPVAPVRVLDTRDGTGLGTQPAGVVGPGGQVRLDLSEHVPAGTEAVVLNVTAAAPRAPGNVRVFPYVSGGPVPTVSNVNVTPGVDQPNLVTVRLGERGIVSLAVDGTHTGLVADLAGWYAPGGAAAFEPVAPQRVLDTRDGTGTRRGPVTGGRWVDVRVAGAAGVPADALAVVLNVTAANPTARTHVRVYPAPAASEPQEPPLVSNLNLTPGRDQPNLVTVPVGDGGRVRLYLHEGSADLLADVAGYYAAEGRHGFVPLAPQRLADSRTGTGLGGQLRAGTVSDLQVTGRAGVPAEAVAAVLNVTGVHPRAGTHVRVFPRTTPRTLPLVSTLNLVPGRDEANLAVVPVGTDGVVSLYPHSSDVHAVVDVSGYFAR